MSDETIIKALENEIGSNLKPLNPKYLSGNSNGYSEDPDGNIIGLNLNKSKISDISFLTGLDCLYYLYLQGNKISDIFALKAMKRLTHLDLSNNSIEDFSPLSDLTNLTWLNLSENKISDISIIKKLANLSELFLGSNNISDVSSILGLEKLSYLSLVFNTIKDFSLLKSMDKLRGLDLSGIDISDYSFLKKIENLTQLNLSSQKISDYSFLKVLRNLNRLELIGNNISDISFIHENKKLTHLNLRENEIADPSPLKALKNLAELDLSENSVTDISFLSDIKPLSRVNLSNNKITQLPKTILKLNIEIKYIDINAERDEGEIFFDKGINLFENPIEDPPLAIIKKGREAVEEFFRSDPFLPSEEYERKLIDSLFSELEKKYGSEDKELLKRLINELISWIKPFKDENVIGNKKDEKEFKENKNETSILLKVQGSLGLLWKNRKRLRTYPGKSSMICLALLNLMKRRPGLPVSPSGKV